jgi:hypothetical protein
MTTMLVLFLPPLGRGVGGVSGASDIGASPVMS